jgi:4-hydroxy-tetrahydrodipicolinate reductase
MGRAIIRLAQEQKELEITGAVESSTHPGIGKPLSEATGAAGSGDFVLVSSLSAVEGSVDAVIDFTTPESTLANLQTAAERGIPYVIGTTGFDAGQLEKIREFARSVPVLLSPNMSYGVNVMLEALSMLSRFLGADSDIEIIEAHHNRKADAPSGTALKLFEKIRETLGADRVEPLFGREGRVGPRKRREVGIHAVRAGSIVGEHTVLFSGLDEEIRLVHRAHSRDTFARGALKCAAFLAGRPAGFYDMKSVMGLG